MSGPVRDVRIGQRALGRATLARQWLLHRHDASVPAALEHLVGLQAQATEPPYIGLWARLSKFAIGDLDLASTQRAVVRCALMRSTLHLVSASDALRLRPVLQQVQERAFLSSHKRHVTRLNLADVAVAAYNVLEEDALTYQALGERLRHWFPEMDGQVLADAARTSVALAQAPPITWGGGIRVRMLPLSVWLAQPLSTEVNPVPMILRYLEAYGPASIADIRAWSGLQGVTDVMETLRKNLRTYRTEAGVELFDLPHAPIPDEDSPAPARLLGGFDAVILGFADRSRFLDDTHRRRIATANGIFHPLILVDGRVCGTWKLRSTKDTSTIELTLFSAIPSDSRYEVISEAEALLAMVSPNGRSHDVQLKFVD